jgi:hypothetical protein
MTSRDIMQQLKLNDRTFRRYVRKIRDRNVTDQLAKRQKYFLYEALNTPLIYSRNLLLAPISAWIPPDSDLRLILRGVAV